MSRPVAEAVRAIGVTQFALLPLAQGVWRPERQLKCLRNLEKEYERLHKAASNFTLEKLIVREANSGKLLSPPAVF